jgi:transcriptional regulator with XRE-family HTH domain
MVMSMNMLPVQCKMARTALGLGIRDLAARAKVSPDTIARFERGEALKQRTIESIRAALCADGVEFIAADTTGGIGVRLRQSDNPEPAAIEVEDLNSSNDE